MEKKSIGYVILEGLDVESDATVVKSDKSSNRVIAEGVLQTAEEQNRNGRCYLTEDLQREIACERTKELLEKGYMRGECGHPLTTDVMRQQTIVDSNCSVKFLKFWMDGPTVKGQFRGTNNALGEAFDRDLRDGDKPAFSLRALGTLENIKGRDVVCNLKMITYDTVIFPSHPGAYTERIVSESASYLDQFADPNFKNFNEGGVIPITNDDVIKYIKTESANIKSILNQIDVLYESAKVINNGTDVQLVAKNGDIFVVNLESHIQNDIQNYCAKILGR